jgi:hypothetical protein
VNKPAANLLRLLLSALLLLGALAACGESPSDAAGSANVRAADQGGSQNDIPVEKVVRDVVGRVVPITEASGEGAPTDWTFEADEFKQVEIVESQLTGNTASIVIFMTTRNNPGPNEDAVQVSGKLQLRYERANGRWNLKAIENLNFRYTVGLAT